MLARVKGWLTTPSTLRPLQWLAAAVTPVAVRSIQAALKQIICFFFEEEEEEHPPGMSLCVTNIHSTVFIELLYPLSVSASPLCSYSFTIFVRCVMKTAANSF